MQQTANWCKSLATGVAVAVLAILIGGILMVPYRSLKAPQGYDQPRIHWNTKNSTRFDGRDLEEVAAVVSRAVYPATEAANKPDVVILFAPDDWSSGLLAASLLRPLNAALLPATQNAGTEIGRLQPAGSQPLNGLQVLLVGAAEVAEARVATRRIGADEIAEIRTEMAPPPRHAVLVSAGDAGTALLSRLHHVPSGWPGAVLCRSDIHRVAGAGFVLSGAAGQPYDACMSSTGFESSRAGAG